MKFILANWEVFTFLGGCIAVFSINNYKTNKTTQDMEEMKENHSQLITLDKARELFVSRELHDNQMKHIDDTLGEIKQQNQQILEKLISK